MSSATSPPTSVHLVEMLENARRNNSADGITGLLIFHDGNFFQVLEGPKENVEACYGRIKKDRRHCGCLVLRSQQLEARNFARWDMASIPFADLSPEHQTGFIDLHDLNDSGKMRESTQDRIVSVLLDTFLSSFGDSSFKQQRSAG